VEDFEPWSAEDIVFRRGFAEAMSLAGRAFLTISDGLFQSTPLRDVRLVAIAPYLDELAASPHLARLQRLDLSGNRIGLEGVRTLLRSPHLGRLKSLDLSHNDLGPAGAAELAGWPSQLESLSIAGNGLSGDDVRRLLEAPLSQALVELDLTHNPLGPGLMSVLGKFLARSIRLALGFTGLTAADVRDLARSPARPRTLDLRFNDLGDPGIQALAGSDLLSRCESLNLRGNRLTRVPGLPDSLTRLDLSVNPLGDDGVLDVVGSGRPGLIDLRLTNVLLTAAGLERLASGGGLVGLERLDLGGNMLGDNGAKVLAGCPDLTGLRELDLTATDLGFAGAAALAGSSTLAGLRVLSVGQNPRLPVDGLQLIRQRFPEASQCEIR
jgi:Leucine-rich repeat (LRR) protein